MYNSAPYSVTFSASYSVELLISDETPVLLHREQFTLASPPPPHYELSKPLPAELCICGYQNPYVGSIIFRSNMRGWSRNYTTWHGSGCNNVLRARLDTIGEGVFGFADNYITASKKSVGTVDPIKPDMSLENCLF